jgi:hypothetical protein
MAKTKVLITKYLHCLKVFFNRFQKYLQTIKRMVNLFIMNSEKISSFAPLPIRIMAGIAFILHAYQKLKIC